MSKAEFDWNDIPLALALAQSGSMRAAGEALEVETSTISRRLASLEKALGTRLFIRSNRGYEPTDAGRVFVQQAGVAFGQVQSLLCATRAEAEGISGPVRLSATDALFDHWLIDRLPELVAAQPGLQLRLVADNRNVSFTRREADLALRLGRPTGDAALLMRKLGRIGFAVYAGEGVSGPAGRHWAQHAWLSYDDDLSATPEMQWLRRLDPNIRPVLKASSVTTLMRACESGLGLALLPVRAGDRSRLRRLSPKPELHREVWLLSHRDASKIKRFRAVADWLVKAFVEED